DDKAELRSTRFQEKTVHQAPVPLNLVDHQRLEINQIRNLIGKISHQRLDPQRKLLSRPMIYPLPGSPGQVIPEHGLPLVHDLVNNLFQAWTKLLDNLPGYKLWLHAAKHAT